MVMKGRDDGRRGHAGRSSRGGWLALALAGVLLGGVASSCTKARAVSPDEQQARVAPAKTGAAATVYTVKVPGVG